MDNWWMLPMESNSSLKLVSIEKKATGIEIEIASFKQFVEYNVPSDIYITKQIGSQYMNVNVF